MTTNFNEGALSFSDRPALSAAQKLGCVAYVVLGTLVIFYGLIGASLGHCAPEPDGSGCEYDGWVKFGLFPGTLLVVLAGGFLLARNMMKDRD